MPVVVVLRHERARDALYIMALQAWEGRGRSNTGPSRWAGEVEQAKRRAQGDGRRVL